MSKRKADSFSQPDLENGKKKVKQDILNEKPVMQKKAALLFDDSDSGDDSPDGGVALDGSTFKINEEYAKRFEHNKKREELQRLEEKYKKKSNGRHDDDDEEEGSDDESSTSEEEDDEGFLVTEDLDAEISATLHAIRSKDPRVYDTKVQFFKPIEKESEGLEDEAPKTKQEKPMYLSDYHRANIMKGYTGAEEEEEEETPVPRTYAEEQEDLKKSIVEEMNAAVDDGEGDDEDDFLVAKSKPAEGAEPTENGVHPSRAINVAQKVVVDVAIADKDPELFLSNFMAARAWVPQDDSVFQPLDEDDEEDEKRAETFETAYNMRFEDPENSNEVLKSYARDIVAARSVRRDEPHGRRKLRERERERKEEAKRERGDKRARLRKLKIEQMEEKLQKIKKTAGLNGKSLKDEDLAEFLNEDWDDDKWEKEMSKRFGEDYYAGEEGDGSGTGSEDDDINGDKKKKKPKKPKWDDDININDLIPEFDDGEKPDITLSDSENEEVETATDPATSDKSSSRTHKQEKALRKKAARLERRKIEDLVDAQLDLDLDLALHATRKNAKGSRQPTRFHYRETSPTTFGLTARDILMAPSDAALNEFVGLKKLASFRDAEKKRKDRKKLGKKSRLREWRRATFGREDGPDEKEWGGFADYAPAGAAGRDADDNDGLGKVNIVEGGSKKKRKRSRKDKRMSSIEI